MPHTCLRRSREQDLFSCMNRFVFARLTEGVVQEESSTVRCLDFWIALTQMGFRSCRRRNDGCWVMVSLPVRAQSAPDPSPTGLHQSREQDRKEGTHSTRPQNKLPSWIRCRIFGTARLPLNPHTTALLLQNTSLLSSMPGSRFHAVYTSYSASMRLQTRALFPLVSMLMPAAEVERSVIVTSKNNLKAKNKIPASHLWGLD